MSADTTNPTNNNQNDQGDNNLNKPQPAPAAPQPAPAAPQPAPAAPQPAPAAPQPAPAAPQSAPAAPQSAPAAPQSAPAAPQPAPATPQPAPAAPQPAPATSQSTPATSGQQAPDLSKYKMEFKNVTFQQLIELAKSSVLLEPNDIPKFEQKYQSMQTGNPELDKAFNVLFEEEFEYLEEEIVEMKNLLAGELKGDENTDKLLKVYESRLEVLKQIKAQIVK